MIWRDLYAMACYGNAGILLLENQLVECIRTLDLGIILGHNLYQKRLQSLIDHVHPRLVAVTDSKPFPVLRFDESENEEDKESDPGPDRECMHCSVDSASMMDSNRMIPSVRSEDLDLVGFITEHFNKGQPVLMKGLVSHWPAMRKWSDLEYLRQSAGFRTVPVEIGSVYTDDEWTQKLMPLHVFISQYLLSPPSDNEGGTGYLAQHLLFEQIQCLRADFEIPEFVHCGGSEFNAGGDINCWFGPNGTTTPIHHDPKHNILSQVVGYKYLRIWPPSESGSLYPRRGLLSNTSRIDPALGLDILEKEYPKFKDAKYLDVWLEPGDALYLPPKWWHYVQSKSISFSVSFWFS